MIWPNLISIFRLLLVIPLVIAMRQHAYGVALLLLGLAGVSDWLDGFIARRFKWVTPTGAMLDSLADKILITGVILAMLILGLLPIWLFALIFLRDLQVSLGFLVWIIQKRVPQQMRPRFSGKIAVASQLILLLLTLMNQCLLQPWPLLPIYIIAAGVTLFSMLDYLLAWLKLTRTPLLLR